MSNYIEHQEHEKISWRLPTGVVLFVLTILVGFVLHEKPAHPFVLSIAETHAQVLKPEENTIGLKQVASLLASQDKAYRFIDLRSPHAFLKGHIPGAINIPIHRLLDSEFEPLLNPTDGTINILYDEEHSVACAPWMLLYQMGYRNNRLMMGGYAVVRDNILNRNNVQAVAVSDEKARYNYAEMAAQTPSAGANTAPATDAAKPAAPVQKKKAASAGGGGGC